MKTATALMHDEFVTTLRYFMDNGATGAERELARTALDLYLLAASDQSVVSYVNKYAEKALWS
jgi:hypothetical protein